MAIIFLCMWHTYIHIKYRKLTHYYIVTVMNSGIFGSFGAQPIPHVFGSRNNSEWGTLVLRGPNSQESEMCYQLTFKDANCCMDAQRVCLYVCSMCVCMYICIKSEVCYQLTFDDANCCMDAQRVCLYVCSMYVRIYIVRDVLSVDFRRCKLLYGCRKGMFICVHMCVYRI